MSTTVILKSVANAAVRYDINKVKAVFLITHDDVVVALIGIQYLKPFIHQLKTEIER